MLREILQARNLSYRQDGFLQLAGVNLRLMEGETLGLAGRRGSGVSNLARILSGELHQSGGQVLLHNRQAAPKQLAQSAALVTGASRLLPGFSVAESLLVPAPGGAGKKLYRKRRALATAKALLQELGLGDIGPDTAGSRLPVARQHIVRMANLVLSGRSILVLHSIALEYTDAERRFLLETLRRLNAIGISILYTTPTWDVILENLQRIAVIRDGRCVKTIWDGSHTREALHHYLYGFVGNVETTPVRARVGGQAAPALSLGGLTLEKGRMTCVFDDNGSGGALVAALRGKAREQQLEPAVIQSDSMIVDWIPAMSMADNLLMPVSRRASGPLGHISRKVKALLVRECCEALSLPVESAALPLRALTRKDLIRLLFYRWEQRHPGLYLLYNATQECDLAEREIIYGELQRLVDGGNMVLYISTNLKEIALLGEPAAYLTGSHLEMEGLQ